MKPGIGVDCRFSLAEGFDSAAIESVAAIFEPTDELVRCVVDEVLATVECPLLASGWSESGTQPITLVVDGQVVADAAVLETVRDRSAEAFVDAERREQVVFPGRGFRLRSFPYEPLDEFHYRIRERGDRIVIRSGTVPGGPSFVEKEAELALDLEPGRYRLWPCFGPDRFRCEEVPGGYPFQVIDPTPVELVAGHNFERGDRINIVFVGSGLDHPDDDFPPISQLARGLLGLDGPTVLTADGSRAAEGELGVRLAYGPMAIEPLASSPHRFNFWYLEAPIMDEEMLLSGADQRLHHEGFELANLQITALHHDPAVVVSDARASSLVDVEQPVDDRRSIRFGDARVWVRPGRVFDSSQTLAHEWGHGLFELRDEYTDAGGRPVELGYPNCAADVDQGRVWWGSLVPGTADPFAVQVEADQRQLLADSVVPRADLTQLTSFAPSRGGCYGGPEALALRPTADSLMNREVPVFGPVNRTRVEQVLERFSGTAAMSSVDEVSLECVATDGVTVCTGSLAPYVDPPRSRLSLGDAPCQFGLPSIRPDGSSEPTPVACVTSVVDGDSVSLRFRSEMRLLPVEVLPPAPATTADRPVDELESGAVAADDRDDTPNLNVGNGRLGMVIVAVGIAVGMAGRSIIRRPHRRS